MGDRANVVIRDDWPADLNQREAVFLYTHWGGSELPEQLRDALIHGRGRWGDPSYLARIVLDRMTRDDADDITGYGISTRLGDNEYPLLVLHVGRVYAMNEQRYHDRGFDALDEVASIGFDEYIAIPRTWDNLMAAEKPLRAV